MVFIGEPMGLLAGEMVEYSDTILLVVRKSSFRKYKTSITKHLLIETYLLRNIFYYLLDASLLQL